MCAPCIHYTRIGHPLTTDHTVMERDSMALIGYEFCGTFQTYSIETLFCFGSGCCHAGPIFFSCERKCVERFSRVPWTHSITTASSSLSFSLCRTLSVVFRMVECHIICFYHLSSGTLVSLHKYSTCETEESEMDENGPNRPNAKQKTLSQTTMSVACVCTYFAATMSKSFNRWWADCANNIYRTQSILISIFFVCSRFYACVDGTNPLGKIYYLCLSPLSILHVRMLVARPWSRSFGPVLRRWWCPLASSRIDQRFVSTHKNEMWLGWRK